MKKGISLISLIATIAIMMILISAVTISAISISNNSKKNAFAIELSLIQESVDSYKIRNNGEFPVTDTIVLNLNSVDSSVINREFNSEDIIDGKIILQKIDYEKIGISSLKYGTAKENQSDVYALSSKTGKVYYVRGLEIGGKVYFTLSNELLNKVGNSELQNTSTSGIIFKKSNDNYTNEDITVELKVPEEYKNVSVLVDTRTASKGIAKDGYVIYTLTGLKNDLISIAYTDDGNSKTVKYTINNYDNISPTLKLKDINSDLKPDQIITENTETKKSTAYMEIIEKSDNLSGVKIVKYENEAIKVTDIKDYFKTNGREVKTNIIPIEKNVQNMTIYIEDNAGNYAYINNIKVEDDIFSKLLVSE